MTSGVSRSRNFPGSASEGEAKTRVIREMQTLRTTHSDESEKGIVADREIRRKVAQMVESHVRVSGAELRCKEGYLGCSLRRYLTWFGVGGSEE